MNNKIYVIDSGHAGEEFSYYETPGKRSPDGKFFEGANNRRYAKALVAAMNKAGLRAVNLLSKCPIDVSLKQRIKWINDFTAFQAKRGFDVVLISLHSNAAGNTWSDADGTATWCCPSKSSLRLATSVHESIAAEFCGDEFCGHDRVDRGVRPTRWIDKFGKHRKMIAILDKTKCTAVLVEGFFHTSKKEIEMFTRQTVVNLFCEKVVEGVKNESE